MWWALAAFSAGKWVESSPFGILLSSASRHVTLLLDACVTGFILRAGDGGSRCPQQGRPPDEILETLAGGQHPSKEPDGRFQKCLEL